jgi:hypothetical protein
MTKNKYDKLYCKGHYHATLSYYGFNDSGKLLARKAFPYTTGENGYPVINICDKCTKYRIVVYLGSNDTTKGTNVQIQRITARDVPSIVENLSNINVELLHGDCGLILRESYKILNPDGSVTTSTYANHKISTFKVYSRGMFLIDGTTGISACMAAEYDELGTCLKVHNKQVAGTIVRGYKIFTAPETKVVKVFFNTGLGNIEGNCYTNNISRDNDFQESLSTCVLNQKLAKTLLMYDGELTTTTDAKYSVLEYDIEKGGQFLVNGSTAISCCLAAEYDSEGTVLRLHKVGVNASAVKNYKIKTLPQTTKIRVFENSSNNTASLIENGLVQQEYLSESLSEVGNEIENNTNNIDYSYTTFENTDSFASTTNRWDIAWDGIVKNGDKFDVSCDSGYQFYAGIFENGSFVKNYTNNSYTSDSINIIYNDGDFRNLRIRVKRTDDAAITESEVLEHVHFSLHGYYPRRSINTRLTELETSAVQREISILFIGNSLTQDAVSYLPSLMKELAPQVNFKFYIWYNGGKTLKQQYEDYFVPNNACGIFSRCENTESWTNTSMTMSSILSVYNFDIVCLQEYFNYKESYTIADLADFNNCVNYIQTHYNKAFRVMTLFHAPKRSDAQSIFNLTLAGNKLILENTCAEGMFSPGIAIYKALSTTLNSLGDQGGLSNDGTHAQEGLPCLLEAFTMYMEIANLLGIPNSIVNEQLRITTENYPLINVPGPNLGTGVITGTTEQNYLAQKVATIAYKYGIGVMNKAFDNIMNA